MFVNGGEEAVDHYSPWSWWSDAPRGIKYGVHPHIQNARRSKRKPYRKRHHDIF